MLDRVRPKRAALTAEETDQSDHETLRALTSCAATRITIVAL
jgi:hypothetical protein